VVGFGIEGHGDHETIMRAQPPANSCSTRSLQRENARSASCGSRPSAARSDTTSGCGANPTVGNAFDKLHPLGNHAVLRRDDRDDRRRADRRRALRERRRAPDFMFMFDRYQR
jgi:(2R)-sulfolactate sulfo-lyase subunit beta